MAAFPPGNLPALPPQGPPPGGQPPPPGGLPGGPMPPAQPIGGGPPPRGGMQGLAGLPLPMLLALLAGAGLQNVVQSIEKLRKPPGEGANRAHKGGVRLDAAQAPGMTIGPLLQQLMAAMQRKPPVGAPPMPPGPPAAPGMM